jgi:hypothetical protein
MCESECVVTCIVVMLQARFTKKYSGDRHLVGVFLRDHRENIANCQVLVTVPQCLELLLVSMVSIMHWMRAGNSHTTFLE